ncbi:MAG: CDC27 family protein [Polyangiaceae bacterium]
MKRVAIAVLLSALSLANPAVADDPTPEDAALATQLFTEAKPLYDAGDFSGAAAKLAESFRLDPKIGTEYQLANCLEKLHKLREARDHFAHVAQVAGETNQPEKADYAKKRADETTARIPKLVVDIGAGDADLPGLAIEIDGAPVERAQWGTPIERDPGKITWKLHADGREDRAGELELREGETTRWVPFAPPPPPKETTPLPDPGEPRRIAGFVIGAVGLGGLIAGAAAGAIALNSYSESNDHCDASNACDRAGLVFRDRADLAATISDVGLIAGGVLAAAGLILVVTALPPSDPKPATPTQAGELSLTIGFGGARLLWTY